MLHYKNEYTLVSLIDFLSDELEISDPNIVNLFLHGEDSNGACHYIMGQMFKEMRRVVNDKNIKENAEYIIQEFKDMLSLSSEGYEEILNLVGYTTKY